MAYTFDTEFSLLDQRLVRHKVQPHYDKDATYLIRANPLLTYAQKPRTETEEKAYSSERAKEAVR